MQTAIQDYVLHIWCDQEWPVDGLYAPALKVNQVVEEALLTLFTLMLVQAQILYIKFVERGLATWQGVNFLKSLYLEDFIIIAGVWCEPVERLFIQG